MATVAKRKKSTAKKPTAKKPQARKNSGLGSLVTKRLGKRFAVVWGNTEWEKTLKKGRPPGDMPFFSSGYMSLTKAIKYLSNMALNTSEIIHQLTQKEVFGMKYVESAMIVDIDKVLTGRHSFKPVHFPKHMFRPEAERLK